MAQQTHLLIDSAESIVHDGVIAQGDGPRDTKWQVRLRTCRGCRSEGVQVIEIDNGRTCIDVLPTRGMGVWRMRRKHPSQSKGGERVLGWQAPAREPVHPAFVPLMEPAGLGWLDGFNELLCRCGLESNGPPEFDESGRLLRPLHGRITNTPAHRVELVCDNDSGLIALHGVVEETRFHFQSLRLTTSLTTSLDSSEFSWDDEVENIGGRDASLQMLYHFNIGQPLMQPGARITAPIGKVAPLTAVAAREGVDTWNIMPPPRPGSDEQVYVAELLADPTQDTRLIVGNLTDNEAVSLRFNRRTLPCFTVWRNTPAEADGYVLGIEPGTNFPNPRTFEDKHGRVVKLKPGESWRAAITATWHDNPKAIADELAAIAAIQKGRSPETSKAPRAEMSVQA